MSQGPTLAVDNGRAKKTLVQGGSVRGSLQYDLAIIKDDLGITGSADDAWLERRIVGLWARFETYTSRTLSVPPATFTDDWGEISSSGAYANQPPVLDFPPVSSPFLRVCPVVSVDALERNGEIIVDGAPGVAFEARSGKLFSLDQQLTHDVSRDLLTSRVRITYKAGWDEIPADLYEALIGCLTTLWGGRSGQAAGIPGGGSINAIAVTDVGSLEIGNNSFVEAATKRGGGGINDPLLGPYTAILDSYYDARVNMGSPLIATTTLVPDAP